MNKARRERIKSNGAAYAKAAIILIIVLVLFGIGACTAFCLAEIDPPRDSITALNYPLEYFCSCEENRIDYQTEGNCATYAAAFVLRSLGEQTDGEMLAPKMERVFGFVPARSIVRILEKYGFSANAYHGDIKTLKQRLSGGVPVIVFVSIPGDTHYAVVVGYDAQYFYLADPLAENKNADGSIYNRKLTTEEFEKIWETDTILSDCIYIVTNRLNSDFVQ